MLPMNPHFLWSQKREMFRVLATLHCHQYFVSLLAVENMLKFAFLLFTFAARGSILIFCKGATT